MYGLVMVAATNEGVDRLNAAAQAVRSATGERGYALKAGAGCTWLWAIT